MFKMVFIVYNEAVELEAMEALSSCGASNYTKITGVFGKGDSSGAHLGNDIWPGMNNSIYVACEEKQAKEILDYVRKLRKKIGAEGIKAFLMPLEDMT
ncbi:MAG: hypothetical protein PHQ84_04230 [Candidatus Omnitrophica bacterium]|jgi:nitrogen regulatory protein PII|nr:hypothetical protein [Candidatus Omnitrophota bacterium]MDD3274232.1 hypothetical protein [Candidatus Omnitrophota bacterium]MDD5078195.1 hypothetical protein [Candidatus Omnitrophota bacterium]MDD5724643.1 hypothetical protein [Candidatus Omnitrophota bacterium]